MRQQRTTTTSSSTAAAAKAASWHTPNNNYYNSDNYKFNKNNFKNNNNLKNNNHNNNLDLDRLHSRLYQQRMVYYRRGNPSDIIDRRFYEFAQQTKMHQPRTLLINNVESKVCSMAD